MSYRFVYPQSGATAAPVAGYGIDPSAMSAVPYAANGLTPTMFNTRRQRSYSPGSFSSDSESSDDYEYRGRMITRETRRPRDVVRAPTPPPIIKRVVERAPTPEAPVMERVIIRPQAQEIVERVIEQPRTPPPRIIEKEMQEEAPPPIVRTRVIKVDRPLRSGFSQPGSPYANPCPPSLQSFSHGLMPNNNPFRAQSIVGSLGGASAHQMNFPENPTFSSASSFEYAPPAQLAQAVQAPQTMMMMPQGTQGLSQNQVQSLGVMQGQPMTFQQAQPQQQMMYRPIPMGAPMMPQMQSSFAPQNFMFPFSQAQAHAQAQAQAQAHAQAQVQPQGMSFAYRPMMQQQPIGAAAAPRMIPSGMPMMQPAVGTAAAPGTMFNPMAQQMVY